MQMNREQATAAINAGLAVTDPESDLLDVFRKHASGIILLRGLLNALATGQIILSQPDAEEPPAPVPPPAPPKKK
jgi:hypothetical protein